MRTVKKNYPSGNSEYFGGSSLYTIPITWLYDGGRGLMYGPSSPMDITGAEGLGAKYLGVNEQLAVPLGGIVLLSGNASLGDADALAEVGQLD